MKSTSRDGLTGRSAVPIPDGHEDAWDMRAEDSVEKGTTGLMQTWFFSMDVRDRAGRSDEPTRNRLDDQLKFLRQKILFGWKIIGHRG